MPAASMRSTQHATQHTDLPGAGRRGPTSRPARLRAPGRASRLAGCCAPAAPPRRPVIRAARRRAAMPCARARRSPNAQATYIELMQCTPTHLPAAPPACRGGASRRQSPAPSAPPRLQSRCAGRPACGRASTRGGRPASRTRRRGSGCSAATPPSRRSCLYVVGAAAPAAGRMGWVRQASGTACMRAAAAACDARTALAPARQHSRRVLRLEPRRHGWREQHRKGSLFTDGSSPSSPSRLSVVSRRKIGKTRQGSLASAAARCFRAGEQRGLMRAASCSCSAPEASRSSHCG